MASLLLLLRTKALAFDMLFFSLLSAVDRPYFISISAFSLEFETFSFRRLLLSRPDFLGTGTFDANKSDTFSYIFNFPWKKKNSAVRVPSADC